MLKAMVGIPIEIMTFVNDAQRMARSGLCQCGDYKGREYCALVTLDVKNIFNDARRGNIIKEYY